MILVETRQLGSLQHLIKLSWSQLKTQIKMSSNSANEKATPAVEMDVSCSEANIGSMRRAPPFQGTAPDLTPSENHSILVKVPLEVAGKVPRPWPCRNYQDHSGNKDHYVQMPCSGENSRRWDLIQEKLNGNMTSSQDIQQAILSYFKFATNWDFGALHSYCNDTLSTEEASTFFTKLLPSIISLALQLPDICTQPLPLLRQQHQHAITLSQQQIACLLANAFFCTFPQRNQHQSSYPGINFSPLFAQTRALSGGKKAEKLKCILNYFKRVTESVPTGLVTFKRQVLTPAQTPQWEKSETKLSDLHVTAEGTIESDGGGMLQVDFANKFVGGGVLGHGAVQEEIRFLMCPEMIVSRLFTEVIAPNECLIMYGCEQFNTYAGYRDKFVWAGDFIDTTEIDVCQRRYTSVVAMDALVVRQHAKQFDGSQVRRELNKAYCSFSVHPSAPHCDLPAVATGNWGCGAFGGDLRLKSLLQLMAAAQAHRQLCYFTFADKTLRDDLASIHEFICENHIGIGELCTLIDRYQKELIVPGCSRLVDGKQILHLYQYIRHVYVQADMKRDTRSHTRGATSQSNSGRGQNKRPRHNRVQGAGWAASKK